MAGELTIVFIFSDAGTVTKIRYALLLTALAAGCARGDAGGDGTTVRVAAGLYPLAYVAARVGGPDVAVTDLTPSGAEPHDVELTPSQVSAVERADLVLLVPGLQPAVDAAARGRTAVDAASLLRRDDPHFWLHPPRLATYATMVRDQLMRLDPGNRDRYVDRAMRLTAELTALDAEYRGGLRDCDRHTIVTSHEAFGYLSEYGVTQVGISGLTPDAEPPPARLAAAAKVVREQGVTTIFFESLVSPKVAETLARETGATTAMLDPVESGTDYPAAMRRNLAALRTALGCR